MTDSKSISTKILEDKTYKRFYGISEQDLEALEARYKTISTDDCWLYAKSISGRGYGYIQPDGKTTLVHRVMYENFVGEIPGHLELDHLCFVTRCINPEHLEAVTRGENQRRKVAHRTHCKRGHEQTHENTAWTWHIAPDGSRMYYKKCDACRSIRDRLRYKTRRLHGLPR